MFITTYALPTTGTPFYVDPRTGGASLTPPRGEGSARGGILADAMGLGKTVQVHVSNLFYSNLYKEQNTKYNN